MVPGKMVVEGEHLEEGSTVMVLTPERDEAFALDSQAEAALRAAIAETTATRELPVSNSWVSCETALEAQAPHSGRPKRGGSDHGGYLYYRMRQSPRVIEVLVL